MSENFTVKSKKKNPPRTGLKGKTEEFKSSVAPKEETIEVIAEVPTIEVVQKSNPPPVPPPPVISPPGVTPPAPPGETTAEATGGILLKQESNITVDSQDISAMERTETVSKSQASFQSL